MISLDRKLKVLILGHNGMLGHMVKLYLEQFYEIETIDHRWPGYQFREAVHHSDADYLINCIGAIPQRTDDFNVNIELPIWLDSNFNGRIIHPSSDCTVGEDEYSMSKVSSEEWLMQHGLRTKIIKTSIIGYELDGNASLMEWFLSNSDGEETRGYTDHFWNGSTTLQWAKHAELMIERWNKQMDLTIIGTHTSSKHHILRLLNSIFNRNINVIPFETGKPVNKSLELDIMYGSLENQIREMKEFYEAKKTR